MPITHVKVFLLLSLYLRVALITERRIVIYPHVWVPPASMLFAETNDVSEVSPIYLHVCSTLCPPQPSFLYAVEPIWLTNKKSSAICMTLDNTEYVKPVQRRSAYAPKCTSFSSPCGRVTVTDSLDLRSRLSLAHASPSLVPVVALVQRTGVVPTREGHRTAIDDRIGPDHRPDFRRARSQARVSPTPLVTVTACRKSADANRVPFPFSAPQLHALTGKSGQRCGSTGSY